MSTAAAATLAPASASAPRAGWASNASTAGAASGEWRVVLEARAQPEVEDEGRSTQLQAKGRCLSVSGEGSVAPRCLRTILAWGLPVLEDEKIRGKGGVPQRVRQATWEENVGSQSVSKPVSETEPLLDKRVIKEKVKETQSYLNTSF